MVTVLCMFMYLLHIMYGVDLFLIKVSKLEFIIISISTIIIITITRRN